jgi:beta-mannanase
MTVLSPARRRRLAVPLVVGLLLATLPLGAEAATGAAPPAAVAPPQPERPVAVPAAGAYLGALVEPPGSPATSNPGVASELQALTGPSGGAATITDGALSRPLSLVVVDQPWSSDPDQIVYQTYLDQIFATGAVPLIEWSCGATDGGVADGSQDPVIVGLARQLAQARLPVLVNWFGSADGPSAPAACLGQASPGQAAALYVAAYRHIVSLFRSVGATNVSFVWTSDPADAASTAWFPGRNYVDWIGAAADAPASPAMGSAALTDQFGDWYHTYATPAFAKPLLLDELAAYGAEQVSFIDSLASTLPGSMPAVRAVVLDDTADRGSATSLSSAGLAAVASLSANSFYQPSRPAAAVEVRASGTNLAPGQVLKLLATVPGPADGGGTVAFFDGTQALPGCAAVPVFGDAACETSSLTAGTHEISVAYSGDAAYGPSRSGVLAVTVDPLAVAQATTPRIPPAGRTYLGAYVEPTAKSQLPPDETRVGAELAQLPGFNSSLARPLSLVHVFESWENPAPNYQLRQVLADGATPVVDWRCGDYDAHVAAGLDDALITQYADQLKALGGPVFLRWYWEPNITQSAQYPPATRCLPAPPGDTNPEDGGAAAYVAAYRHIRQIFDAQGATNVSFVWAVSSRGDDRDYMSFFPGADAVDWIAIDGYYYDANGAPSLPQPTPASVTSLFGAWYKDFSPLGLPMMISETGAQSGYQAAWIDDLGSAIGSVYPDVRGVLYFDTPAQHQFALDSGGLAAFEGLDGNAGFQPARQPVTVQMAQVTPATPQAGQEVAITAALGATDGGGSLAFYADGSSTPLPGCARLSVAALDLTCYTDSLPPGDHGVTVIYSGDAEYQEAGLSAPVPLMVMPATAGPGVDAPRVPSQRVYLGAWVDPTGTGLGDELTQLPALDRSLGSPLSIASVYQSWTDLTPAWELEKIIATGAIPMVNWTCGDTDGNVAAGADDQLIETFAQELASLHVPVFLRWGFEPNFTSSPSVAACLGDLGPEGYRQAFQHIHDIFQGAGADDVGFVWSLAASDQADMANLVSWYPGSDYVDWIAADAYTTSLPVPKAGSDPAQQPSAPAQLFGSWYDQFSSFGKPMMISETGAPQQDQAAYLEHLGLALQQAFPEIRAVVYVDAPGRVGSTPYQLGPSGTQALAQLAADPYFQPIRSTASLQLAPSISQVPEGRPVTLEASLVGGDGGGAVTYLLNGKTAVCSGLNVNDPCVVKGLPAGSYTFTAVWSGDAEFAPASSSAVILTVAGSSPPPTMVPPPTTGPPPTTVPPLTTVSAAMPGSGAVSTSGLLFTGTPTIAAIGAFIPAGPINVASASANAAGVAVLQFPPPSNPTSRPAGVVPILASGRPPGPFRVPGSEWIGFAALLVACLGAGYIATSAARGRRRARFAATRPAVIDLRAGPPPQNPEGHP